MAGSYSKSSAAGSRFTQCMAGAPFLLRDEECSIMVLQNVDFPQPAGPMINCPNFMVSSLTGFQSTGKFSAGNKNDFRDNKWNSFTSSWSAGC